MASSGQPHAALLRTNMDSMTLILNEEQRIAAECTSRNTLVLAGAGTGKTRTLIGRVIHLIEHGCEPERIVVVTFTRRAANEIKARLRKELGAKASRVVAGTFHHLCLRIMSARRRWFGFDQLTIMDRDDQLHLFRLVRGQVAGKKDATIPKAATLLNYYSYARNTNQSAKAYLEKFSELGDETIKSVLAIFEKYRERKLDGSYLDYDDILHRFAKVLHDDAQVRKNVCERYDHLLVDEMQDTNPLQWLILESFTHHCGLFCVGDDAQSIYAFRGADFTNVHSFQERVSDGVTLKLVQNYRSTQPILDIANWLLDESPLEFDKKLEANKPGGELPNFLGFGSDIEEAEWIIGRLKQRRSEGASWSDHMILCRTAYSARPIEAQLIESRIPYRFVGGIGLLQMAHVRDLLSLLRISLNHRDELAWIRFLTLWPRIGDATASRIISRIFEQDSSKNAFEVFKGSLPKRPEIVQAVFDVLSPQSAPVDLIENACAALAPVLELKYDNWDSRKRDFGLLKRLAANHKSLAAFLETYTLDPVSSSEVDEQDTHDDGFVTLITVHSAKGTEAEVCFVAAVQPGNYPHVRSIGDDAAVEEERRVLYVALTRAKTELVLTRNMGRGFARTSWNASSGSEYFFDTLPTSLVNLGVEIQPTAWYDDDVIG